MAGFFFAGGGGGKFEDFVAVDFVLPGGVPGGEFGAEVAHDLRVVF